MDVDAWNSDYIKARKYSLAACIYLTDPGLIPGAFLWFRHVKETCQFIVFLREHWELVHGSGAKIPQSFPFFIDRRILLVVPHVNHSRLELPGRDLAIEQDIAFTVRAVLELGKEEVGHHPAERYLPRRNRICRQGPIPAH